MLFRSVCSSDLVVTPFVGYQGYSFWAAIAIVLATAAGWGGTTLLYSAVVWGEWEKRECGVAQRGRRTFN